jgi:outer membrane receptor protein involved in Fe transport
MTMVFLSESKKLRLAMMLLIPVFFLLPPEIACPEEPLENAVPKKDELDDELKYLQEETYVITPSKIPQRIEKAPGTVYVVTDKQIRQMGARYLREVVETVPGWYVWQMWRGDVFYARNKAGGFSSEILFMMNSHQVNELFIGSATETYANLDLDNVKRIEFVTGPGSSLYGSGAMAGIINIITKEGDDVDGLQVTGRGGSFNTWEGNALFGKTIHGLEVAAYADYRTTDGFQGHVDQDFQSVMDQRYGTHASLAPGNMKGDAYQWDAQLTLKYEGFKFDGKYIDKKRDWAFGWWTPTLDNISNQHNKDYYLNLSYDATPTEGLDLMVKAYRNQHSLDQVSQVFPEGSFMMTPSGPMLNSVNRVAYGEYNTSRMGAEAQVVYEIVDSNTLVGGITFEQQKFYDNEKRQNILTTANPYIWIPLPSVHAPPDQYIIPDEKRNVYAAYLEDIWDILDDLRLTVGGRYDYYSDSGGQFSPRLGLNYGFFQNYYTKFQYARSFRAPYFAELYDPFYGDPDLKNETDDTLELSFGLNLLPFSGQVTVFRNEYKDSINVSVSGNPPTYQYRNNKEYTRYGVELQMKYDFGRGTYLSMNYTHTSNDYPAGVDENIGYMRPERFGTLMGNVRLNKYLNLNAYLIYRGGWVKPANDPREAQGDYVIVNTALVAKDFIKELKGLEFRGAVYNLFNKDYTSPTGPGELPGDMPMPGINFMLELRYSF